MPAYQPPHLRNRPPGTQDQYVPPKMGERNTTNPSRWTQPDPRDTFRPPSERPGPTTRNWASEPPVHSSRPVLASPAGDLRPSMRSDLHSRPKGVEEDMEFIQSVSRSGGDGAEGDALKNWGLQERYRIYIDKRHYNAFPGPRDRPPKAGATDQLESLSSIVLLFRKLREGVVASGRIDDFAIEVFESSATTAILADNTPQVISSLSSLVPGLYQAVDEGGRPSARSASLNDVTGQLSNLKVGARPDDHRAHYASLLLLFHLCHSDSPSAYHTTLMSLTRPHRIALRTSSPETSHKRTTPSTLDPPDPLLPPDFPSLMLAHKVHATLSIDRFDPISFWRLLADPGISGPERAVMSWASAKVRERAWEVMRKSYLEVDLVWATAWLGVSVNGEGGVEDLAKEKGLKVEGKKIKLR